MTFENHYIDYKDSTSVRYEAILYLRVSDPKQAKKGSGLSSQEIRGREYAKFLQIPVAEIFHDDGISGKILDRPAVQEMLAFLNKAKAGTRYVVIVDDISRLARDYRVHFDLRDAIEKAGALLDSPSTTFKAIRDADSNYVEGIQALGAQHFREKNAETSRNRKWARLKGGLWPYKAPVGYRFEMTHQHGNMLVRDEPAASILQEAFEGYAAGRFATQAEVKRFLESQPDFPGKLPNGTLRAQRITDLITHPIYAGFVFCKVLDIPLTKAKHEPLISLETFEKMQERRASKAVAPARKDIHEDFPLRNFVSCRCCGNPLTAGWSKGKYKKYPYYLCQNKDCEDYGKSIRRDDIEGDFADLLKSMRPAAPLFDLIKAMFFDAWNQREQHAEAMQKTLKRDSVKLDKQIDSLLDRLVEADSPTAIRAYERKIEQLEKEKLLLTEKLENGFKPKASASDILELSMQFLSNPCKLWESGEIALQRLVLRLTFSEHLSYSKKEGYRTPKTTLPFKVLGDFFAPECKMVPRRGLEPPLPYRN